MEIVLGVSMTPTTVRMTLVEGTKADGVLIEQDVLDLSALDGAANSSAADGVLGAILGTEEGAVMAGHHLVSIGVTWSNHAEAAVLRAELENRGIDDVLLVSELHAAAALAQAIGRAMSYAKIALMLVERDTATLAVVETADGSVVKIVSHDLRSPDAIAALAEVVISLEAEQSLAQGMFIVGSGAEVAAVKAHLQDLLSIPVIAPEEPQLALARGAALAAANAPRFDTSTIGLAYSQYPGETVARSMAMTGGATDILDGGDGATGDIDSRSDDAQEDRKPFLLVGSTLAAVFAAGLITLTVTLAVNSESAVDQIPRELTTPTNVLAPSALPTAPVAPPPVAQPAPAAPPSAANATAQRMIPPAPPPSQVVVVREAAPAPAAPPPPAPPPPVAPPPPLIQPVPVPPWLAPWLPPVQGPRWNPFPKIPPGHGGGGGPRGHGGD